MSTPFTDIYDLNHIVCNNKYLKAQTDNMYYYLLYIHLLYAISFFEDYCYKDLADRVNFKQEIYTFKYSGVDTFAMSPIPPINCEYYVSINGVKTNDFVIVDNDITINNLTTDDIVYIGAYSVGEFNVDMSDKEKTILSDGMLVPFQKKFMNDSKQLCQSVYGTEWKIYSQANHNDGILRMNESQIKELTKRITKYTYTDAPDGLQGMSKI